MNKYIIIIMHILISWPIATLAIQTNVNEVTDLFDKHIENKQELLEKLEEQNNNAIQNLESGEHHEAIDGIGRAESKASELNSIEETQLDNAGRAKRASEEYKFYDENELEPDYTKEGNRLHKQDSDDIVSTTENEMHKIGDSFMAKLNSEGFDCKTVKGPVNKEPVHYIEIKREEQKNTEYNQFFCEEPRNTYNCNDELTLKCQRTGKAYGQWQDRRIRFNGHTLHWEKMNWGYALHWKRKRWGWHIHSHHPGGFFFSPSESPWRNNPAAIIADARAYIANHLQVPIEQIGEHVEFPAAGRGIGNIGGVGCRWRVVWDEYEFGYKYRDSYDICEQWSEDWNERCILK